uniref:DUF834 domain-containing protein n=1 Tax=Oryza brachyantha TaxID=4533 RepID=J3MPK1_ORYBR
MVDELGAGVSGWRAGAQMATVVAADELGGGRRWLAGGASMVGDGLGGGKLTEPGAEGVVGVTRF